MTTTLPLSRSESFPFPSTSNGGNGMPRSQSVAANMAQGPENHSLMARYLYKQCANSKWLERQESGDPSFLGVAMKTPSGTLAVEPVELNPAVTSAAQSLNAAVAVSMSSEITAAAFLQLTPYQHEIIIPASNIRFPVVESMDSIRESSYELRNTFVCMVRRERIVLFWANTVESILSHGADVESKLLSFVWGSSVSTPNQRHSPPRLHSYQSSLVGSQLGAIDEKQQVFDTAIRLEEGTEEEVYDPEAQPKGPSKRPMVLTHSFMVGLAMILVVVVEVFCVANLLSEIRYDGNYSRLGLIATIPVFAAFALFFMVVITGSLFQIAGPVADIKGNSRYHSAIAPKPERHRGVELPHITIQMPVYKEGLRGVIVPTVTSLMAAIRHYESVGGTASIFINEDGMQTIQPEVAEARKLYYAQNHIGWCSRPPHGKDGFLRKGQFKKASNMNYCLDFSIRVEDELLRLIAQREAEHPQEAVSVEEENALYDMALARIIEQDDGRTQAAGNVRLGEIILLVDCDTRVPIDCLQLGALEMIESPDVAIIQHASGVMQVVHNLFENGITYFTNLIYTSIQFAVGNGDCAPFVGHNAFLRWKAVQSVSFQEDGVTKFWSDSHVSEDFDISLRLQIQKFVVRLASYHHGGFKEGVSLTVYDELARWEKYAYGCNELVFHPIHKWIYRGPFTRLFLRFLWSDIKITSKITILAYIFTYYAIAAALPLTLANYLLMGWIQDQVDQFYLASWKIFVGMLVVFNGLSPLAFAAIRHRLGIKKFFPSLWETIKWTPLFVLFFGGLSFHLSKALLCHFFSIKMEWTSTSKELEATGFFIGLDKIFKDFKYMYLVVIIIAAGMIYLGVGAPRGWKITDFTAIVPLSNQVGCHFLLPLALGLF